MDRLLDAHRKGKDSTTIEPQTASAKTEKYSPYRFDWRFLPEELLLAKDYVRPQFIKLSNTAAVTPLVRRVWLATAGRSTLRSIESARCLFIHIPKNGGTSVSKCIYGRNLPHYSARFYSEAFPKSILEFPSFAIIRHPVERMLSAYRFILLGGTDMIATNRYARFLVRKSNSFDTFVSYLVEDRRRLLLFETLQEQTSYIVDSNNRVMIDRLFSLDDANGLSSELSRVIGVDKVPHINATRQIEVAISPDSKRKIRDLYDQDFRLYDQIVARGGSMQSKGMLIQP